LAVSKVRDALPGRQFTSLANVSERDSNSYMAIRRRIADVTLDVFNLSHATVLAVTSTMSDDEMNIDDGKVSYRLYLAGQLN
jgi:hypothetical protein